MKTIIVVFLLLLSGLVGYQGYIYSQFDGSLTKSEEAFYNKEYGRAISIMDEMRNDRWYKPLKKYAWLDVLEIDKKLDYQKGRTLVELGNLKEAYALFDQCANARSSDLAYYCLYQQGNIALYQGNITTAEKKWQASLEKSGGGHDFDAQVNLELLKNQKNKSDAAAVSAMLTHRRNKPYFHLRPPSSRKSGTIKP